MGASQTSAILLLLLLFQCSKTDSILLRFLGQLFLFLCVYCLFPTQAFVLLASSFSSVGDPVPLEGSLGKYSKSFKSSYRLHCFSPPDISAGLLHSLTIGLHNNFKCCLQLGLLCVSTIILYKFCAHVH